MRNHYHFWHILHLIEILYSTLSHTVCVVLTLTYSISFTLLPDKELKSQKVNHWVDLQDSQSPRQVLLAKSKAKTGSSRLVAGCSIDHKPLPHPPSKLSIRTLAKLKHVKYFSSKDGFRPLRYFLITLMHSIFNSSFIWSVWFSFGLYILVNSWGLLMVQYGQELHAMALPSDY